MKLLNSGDFVYRNQIKNYYFLKKEYAKKYSLENVATDILEIYDKVLISSKLHEGPGLHKGSLLSEVSGASVVSPSKLQS